MQDMPGVHHAPPGHDAGPIPAMPEALSRPSPAGRAVSEPPAGKKYLHYKNQNKSDSLRGKMRALSTDQQRQRLLEDLPILRESASKYAVYGVYIASASVVIATLMVSYVVVGAITIEGIILAQTSNIALWIVDCMPFLFAIWGQYASFRMAREASELVQHKTQSLREALTQANFTSKAKSDFFAKMSHELRTPISGIIGMSDLLLDTKLSKEQQRHAEIIKTSASSLLTLINDLLDFSKIEAGKLELEEIEFDLRDCMEKSVSLLEQQARLKGLALTTLIQPDVPNRFLGDPGRLRQIIINLLGNAIKFTHAGEVVLSVKKLPETATHAQLHVEVADTGIGMSKKELERLFRPYEQGSAATVRRYGGTGLGLAITKELVETMGGHIDVQSREGKGSVFWFTIKLRKAPEPSANAVPAEIDLKRLRVLVADGNIPARVGLVDQLKALGMEVQSIGNGNAALQMIRAAADSDLRYDLVFVDMFLPNLSGEELGKEIKSRPETRDTIIVMMTSAGVRGDAQRLNQLGFAGYFGKPIPPEHLQDILSAVAATRHMSEPERQRRGLVTKYMVSEQRRQQARLLLVEDSEVNQEIMLQLLSRLGRRARVDVAENGMAAIQNASRETYGLILMDLHLPDRSGIEVIRAIRALPAPHAQADIVVVTAGASDEEKTQCRELGVRNFLIKPVERDALVDILARWQGQLPPPAPGQPASPASVSGDAPAPDRPRASSEADAVAAPDPKLVSIFIRETRQRLDSLRQALNSADARRAAREAHTLKSSSAYFQAHAMHQAAVRIEALADGGRLSEAIPELKALEEAYQRLCDRLLKGAA
jgi:two-component system sensor histidine kinase/response regulator